MVSKLIILPLAVIATLAVFATLGLGTNGGVFGSATIGGTSTALYDSSGTMIFYDNLTAVTDSITNHYSLKQGGASGTNDKFAYFTNGTYVFDILSPSGKKYIMYPLYTDTNGVSPAYWDMIALPKGSFVSNVAGSIGMIAILIGVMALAGVTGLGILGSGLSDYTVGTIVKVSAWMGLWGVFSALAIHLLSSGGTYGYLIFFILSTIYVIAVIDTIGHPSGGD